ncbi:NUDIX hydrolase [Brevibacterium litoralis]|uniref:NUDIX hydrolase n=1 Tax=Brevibacterium litoralis TaxID=3138935 RepID=UPI0032ECA3FA
MRARQEIVVSALVLRHPEEDSLLMVRKRGTTSFMLPGGKPEPGETAEAAIVREISEELGFAPDPADLVELGTWTTAAANEAGHTVTGTVFLHRGLPAGLDVQAPRVLEEIEEAGWYSWDHLPADTSDRQFAPLTRNHVIPALPDWFRAGA